MNTPLDKSKTSVSDAESERIVQQALDNLINSSEHTVMAVDKFHKNEKDKAAIKSANIKRMKEASSHDIETIETKLFSPPVKKFFLPQTKLTLFKFQALHSNFTSRDSVQLYMILPTVNDVNNWRILEIRT